MQVNALGKVVQEEWSRSVEIRQEIRLDAFVVMPNHIHGIVVISNDVHDDEVGAHGRAPLHSDRPPPTSRGRPPRSLGAFIAGFKAVVTKRINENRGTPGAPVWQRNYYEHVIRSDDELNRTIQYITDNPARWAEDAENPMRRR
jgi:REP element-mobilizing transposase RayT